MMSRPIAAVLGLVAALAVAGGTTWAIAQDDAGSPWPAQPSEVLAAGTAPSNSSYEIARIEPSRVGADPAEAFCFQIRTVDDAGQQVGRTQGCDLTADAADGRELRPSFTLLGTDRFFTMLAPEGVTAMEVQISGEAKAPAAKSEALDAGAAGKLLVVTAGGPMVSSRNPASFQDYEVRLLGPSGEMVHEITMGNLR